MKSLSWFLLLMALALPAAADVPVPIKDINSRPGGGQVTPGVEMNGYVYYQACPDRYGCELFRTPIGGSGAELVADLHATSSSSPRNLVNAAGTLFFTAFSNQLWKSDGTEAGTQFVKSFASIPVQEKVALGSQVLFRAELNSNNGRELWVSDGATTTQHDLCPGPCDGDPLELTVSGNRVFFRAKDASDTELWKYESGTATQVGDINAGGNSFPSEINPFQVLGPIDGVIFQADDGTGAGLWTSDGSGNTKVAGATEQLFGIFDMVVAGNLAFFEGSGGGPPTLGQELWVSNGTTPGTAPIMDINPGPFSSGPDDLTVVGSSVFFTADNGTIGRELWIHVPGPMPTTVPLEIFAGASAPPTLRGETFTNLNGSQLFFVADDGSGSGAEPWISNGTPGGTVMVADLEPGSQPANIGSTILAAQNQVFFAASAQSGENLWGSDGTAGGTARLTNLDTATSGSNIDRIVPFAGAGYFCAYDGATDDELWRTDGTTAGTTMLESISGCDDLVAAGSFLYFTAPDGATWNLWKSNGIAGGASLVKAFPQKPQHLTAHAGQLFFAVDDGSGAGQELWKSDGIPANTAMVEDIYLGSTGSNPRNLTSAGSYLYFAARTAVNSTNFAFDDVELHRSDGTVAGTFLVADVYSGTNGSYPTDFGQLGSEVLFAAWDSGGTKLWKTNGTQGNLTLVKNIAPTDPPVVLGGFAYLPANDGTNGNELWRTDGTSGNTTLVQNIRSGSASSSPESLTVAGSKLLFTAIDDSNGREPWTTDGSTTGLLKDINSGSSWSNARNFFATGVGDSAYFSADDGLGGGGGLWHTDGTTGGTSKVTDSFSPENFTQAGSAIVFVAQVGSSGDELWSFGTVDCGDAVDSSYQTLLGSGGACHRVGENSLVLGAVRDEDTDGQPTATADGDDLDGSDDEDGVTFTSAFNLEDTATFDVTVSADSYLNVWIDWDIDGDWDEPEDHVFYNHFLTAGTHSLAVELPYVPALGLTYARFRVDSLGTPSPGGIVFDGEVEDYQIELVEIYDYGDAPDPFDATAGQYPTLLANGGARHLLKAGVYLGSGVDADSDGQPTAGADGDDMDGNDDDDGVVFTTAMLPGASASIDLTASTSGSVWAWIDFDRNGIWNSAEELILDEVAVSAGTQVLNFPVPAGALLGATYGRFRFSNTGDGYDPTDYAESGEVEDYQVFVGAVPPTAHAGPDRSIAPNNQPVALGGIPAATNGTPPYSYAWTISPDVAGTYTLSTPTDANPSFTGLIEQVFTATLTVTDANMLQNVDAATITVEVPQQRDLYNMLLTGTEVYEACNTLVADLVWIASGANIVFRAPIVTLGHGFMVEDGGSFTIINATPAGCV